MFHTKGHEMLVFRTSQEFTAFDFPGAMDLTKTFPDYICATPVVCCAWILVIALIGKDQFIMKIQEVNKISCSYNV